MDTELLYELSLAACRILLAFTAATVGLLLAMKAVRETWGRYAAARAQVYLPALHAFLQVQAGMAPVFLRRRPGDGRILAELLREHARRAQGDAATLGKLSGLYEQQGFAAADAADLRSARWWVRARAAQRLGLMHAASRREALARALGDREVEVRLMAAWALGRFRDLESLRPIFKALAGFSKIAALRVTNIVLSFGNEAVPVVTGLLAVPDPQVQLLALQMLGELSDPRAQRAVLAFLGSEDKELRIAACAALAKLGGPESRARLRAALADAEWPVAAKAAQALGALGDEQAVEGLTALLGHREWWVRLHAGEALARLGASGRRALQEAAAAHADRFGRDMAAQWLDELEHAPQGAAA